MEVCTIGLNHSTAARFFGTLRQAGIRRLVDVRLNNRSQLAGFAKREDWSTFWPSCAVFNTCIIRCWPPRRRSSTHTRNIEAVGRTTNDVSWTSWRNARSNLPCALSTSTCPPCCYAANRLPNDAIGAWCWSTWIAHGAMCSPCICDAGDELPFRAETPLAARLRFATKSV